MDLATLKYPIGRYQAPDLISDGQRTVWIAAIAALPLQMSEAVRGLNDAQLDARYRDGGWTVRQVVHHVADSHMKSTVRFRWALTEDIPLIKAYDEASWAELPDAKAMPVAVSLAFLAALHSRWVMLLNSMAKDDFQRRLRHPVNGEFSLEWMLGLDAWHGHHHVAHITKLRERNGW
jgi:hypothetical protein